MPRHKENRRLYEVQETGLRAESTPGGGAKGKSETRPGADPDRATFSETKDKVNELEFYIFKSIQ